MTRGRLIEWRLSAADDLLAIDRYRQKYRLLPIRAALARVVNDYFGMYQEGGPLPGVPTMDPDLNANDIRLTRVYVGRTGGPYRVLFRYDETEGVYEILHVAHPRENAKR